MASPYHPLPYTTPEEVIGAPAGIALRTLHERYAAEPFIDDAERAAVEAHVATTAAEFAARGVEFDASSAASARFGAMLDVRVNRLLDADALPEPLLAQLRAAVAAGEPVAQFYRLATGLEPTPEDAAAVAAHLAVLAMGDPADSAAAGALFEELNDGSVSVTLTRVHDDRDVAFVEEDGEFGEDGPAGGDMP